jgi:H+/Cl- antiporter ClcA
MARMNAPPTPPALSGAQYLRLILTGALIGLPAAAVAAGFLAFVHEAEGWLWHDLPDALGYSSPPWFLVIGLPVAGAAVVIVARSFLPGDGGHVPLGGLSVEPTPLAHAPGVALAALGTLAFGAVLGPEAPLIALGSAVGMAVAPYFRMGKEERMVLATAGSFSAISALFGGPLVAGVLLIEAGIGAGAMLIPILLPGLVAAAIGYLLFVGLGNWGGIQETVLSVPGLPIYDGTSVVDLVVGIAVGILTALVIGVVRQLGSTVLDRGPARLGLGPLLLAGGLAVGLLAQLADLLGANSQDVLFSGQTSLPDLVAEDSAGILLVLIVAKGLAYAISLSCGFRGGPVFPAIFLGVALGMIAVVAFDVSPTLAVAVGATAGMVAMTRLVIASLLLAALLVGTGSADVLPAAVLAAVAAWITRTAIDKRLHPAEDNVPAW